MKVNQQLQWQYLFSHSIFSTVCRPCVTWCGTCNFNDLYRTRVNCTGIYVYSIVGYPSQKLMCVQLDFFFFLLLSVWVHGKKKTGEPGMRRHTMSYQQMLAGGLLSPWTCMKSPLVSLLRNLYERNEWCTLGWNSMTITWVVLLLNSVPCHAQCSSNLDISILGGQHR